jgi:hypothetical protein
VLLVGVLCALCAVCCVLCGECSRAQTDVGAACGGAGGSGHLLLLLVAARSAAGTLTSGLRVLLGCCCSLGSCFGLWWAWACVMCRASLLLLPPLLLPPRYHPMKLRRVLPPPQPALPNLLPHQPLTPPPPPPLHCLHPRLRCKSKCRLPLPCRPSIRFKCSANRWWSWTVSGGVKTAQAQAQAQAPGEVVCAVPRVSGPESAPAIGNRCPPDREVRVVCVVLCSAVLCCAALYGAEWLELCVAVVGLLQRR